MWTNVGMVFRRYRSTVIFIGNKGNFAFEIRPDLTLLKQKFIFAEVCGRKSFHNRTNQVSKPNIVPTGTLAVRLGALLAGRLRITLEMPYSATCARGHEMRHGCKAFQPKLR